MTGDLIVWAGMTVLAVVFAIVGPMKLSYDQFITRRGSAWARDLGPTKTRLIGVLEILGAVGLVWPLATRTLPWLSVLAGICLTALMVCASYFHTMRGETQLAGLTVLLGVLALVVTLGIVL